MDGYVPNYIEEIKRRLSIVDIISQRVSLKKSGKNFKGLCPFHGEKSPSFYVWPDSESYYCFGCKENGDAFNFLMKTDGLGFGEVLEQLAARTGVSLPERQAEEADPEVARSRQERDRLREANTAAATYFQHLLLKSREGQAAREYLTKRGVSTASIENFGLGYALDSWDSLTTYLTGKGFSQTELVQAGLIGQSEESDRYYDRFRGRVIFPIRDRQGQIIAFGGRVLDGAPKDAPKYLNSPQTLLFDKGATLYGFDMAKEAIRRADRAIIVEGYLDVIMSHQYGHANVVAPLGTALGEKHIGLLKKLTKRVVLALDADTAGQMATLKGLEVAKEGFDTKTVPVPTARGLIRFEQQLDADVRIAVLPAGKDPDEVVREGGGKWASLIERALPAVDYYFATVAATVDLNSARGKSEAIEKLIPAIVEVRDRFQREHYLYKLHRLTHIELELLRSEFMRAARAEPQRRPTEVPAAPQEEDQANPDEAENNEAAVRSRPRVVGATRPLELEDHLLAFLLRYGADPFAVVAADGAAVGPNDFTRSENRLLFEALQTLLENSGETDGLEEGLNPELAAHLERLRGQSAAEPELTDLISIQADMSFRLNRLREIRLGELYERAMQALEEGESQETPETPAEIDHTELWRTVAWTSEQKKLFYPKRSAVFKDSRDR